LEAIEPVELDIVRDLGVEIRGHTTGAAEELC
jgi:hypothetical protein